MWFGKSNPVSKYPSMPNGYQIIDFAIYRKRHAIYKVTLNLNTNKTTNLKLDSLPEAVD